MNHFVSNIDWVKLWLVVGTVSVTWAGLSEIIPQKYFRPTFLILNAIQSGILFAARGGKYVADRTQPPPRDLP